MAITLTDVSVPTAQQQYLSLGNVTGVVKTVTFDSSYPTGGETITAAQAGLSLIYGIVPMGAAVETAGADTAYLVHPVVASDRRSATLQLFQAPAGADEAAVANDVASVAIDAAPYGEVANTSDASAYSVTLLIIGA